MKIIDLFNKIANGEVPKKIKYKNHIYDYYNGDYIEFIDGNYDSNWLLANEIIDLCNLCDEVEILDDEDEEKELPKKLYHCCMESENEEIKFLIQNICDLADKYNDLIDYLEKQRKGE